MKKITLLSILFLAFISSAQKETMNIKIQLLDTNSSSYTRNAVGIVTRVRDSVLLGFQRSDNKGNINLTLPLDTVQFTIEHPNFGNFRALILGSNSNKDFDFGTVQPPEKSTELGEVVVYANKNPIYYRGDTLVFVADSFAVAEGAVVEDLLKKLPGIKVDDNGKITNQGKEINQVLVDGDEFFGGDATIATKNLGASGVETVEIYEKDAEDGSDEKLQVLDLRLKDNAKKGYFGKTNVAGGLNQFKKPNVGFYEADFLLNAYNKNTKIGVFGLGSNTPKTDFSGRDLFKFGFSEGNWNMEESDDMNMNFGSGSNTTEDEGIPQTLKTGFSLNQKVWKGGEINMNYAFNQFQIETNGTTRTQFNLTDTTFFSNESRTSEQKYNTHNFNIKFDQKIDSTSRIEFEPKISYQLSDITNNTNTGFKNERDTLTRTTDLTNQNKADGLTVNTTIRYLKSFKKKNRSLNARYNITLNDENAAGNIETTDINNQTGTQNFAFQQKRKNTSNGLSNNAYIDYFEPINKKWKLEFDYEFLTNFKKQEKLTNVFNGTDFLIDSTLSNGFETSRNQHRFGAFGIYETKKIRFSFGSRIRDIRIENQNIFNNTSINQGLTNLLPRAVFTYKFSQSSRLRLQYNTSSSLPSIDQLQPIPDNSNPNAIRIGNAALRPNYSHSLVVSQNAWKGLEGMYIYSGGSWFHQLDAFSTSTFFSPIGGSVSQTINVDNADFINLYGGGGFPIPKIKDLRADINVYANFNQTENVINGVKNESKSLGFGQNIELDYQPDSLGIGIDLGYDHTRPSNSLSTLTNQPFTNYNFGVDLKYISPIRFTFKSDADYVINTGRAQGYNTNFVVWNASIERAFGKLSNFRIALEAYDILNQNISNFREVNNNMIMDTQSTIIRRYFMLKMTYRFNNFKTKEDDFEGWH